MTALIIVAIVAGVLAVYWVIDFVYDNTVGRGVDALLDKARSKDTATDFDRFKRGSDS